MKKSPFFKSEKGVLATPKKFYLGANLSKSFGPVVRVLDSQSRARGFKTTGFF